MAQSESTTQVALITGGAKRVGRAIVLKLAQSGYDIAFTYLSSKDAAVELVAEITARGRRAIAMQADLTEPTSTAASVHGAFTSEFKRLDVLVNNASMYEPSSLNQTNAEQVNRLWNVHVAAPLLLCQAFAPALRSSRGHIINMVDLLAERPWPQYLAYCTSKAGLWNLTLGLARELAPEVTVNGIAPGVVEWPEQYPQQEREKYLKRVPLGRAGTPEDVANVVHFLCTNGTYVTGQIIRLDGGRSVT
jgi:pteridine reductase